jgi:hypothetical protein
MYLLLKSEQAMNGVDTDTDLLDVGGDAASAIQSHPVIARLQQWNKLAQKLEDRVESKVNTLPEQLDNLVKANALMNVDEDDLDSSKHDGDSEAESDKSDNGEGHTQGKPVAEKQDARAPKVSNSSSSEDESEEEIAASVMNDARF